MGVETLMGRAAGAVTPPPRGPAQPGPADLLLALEAAARAAATPLELVHAIANDWRRLVPYGQAWVLRGPPRRCRVVAVSSQSSVDRTSPAVVAVERGVSRRLRAAAGAAPQTLDLAELGEPDLSELPFPHLCLVPLATREGRVFGAVMLARQEAWADRDVALAARLGESHGHALAALVGRAGVAARPWRTAVTASVVAGLLALAVVPVPLTVMAPAEVVPRDAATVNAPLDGVVAAVDVAPNATVRKGEVLLRFVDTAARGRFDVAEQNVAVARAREQRLMQAAFQDKAARRELAVASAELGLAEAERDAARDQLQRSTVLAERDGVAVFASRKDLEGRPVSTGEKLMTIADPERVEFRVELPVKDSILAREGLPVRVYLDSDPLAPIEASITEAAFHATPQPSGGLAFVLRAQAAAGAPLPRAGYRGTAQVRGETVLLGYLLLRRPITALRQQLWL